MGARAERVRPVTRGAVQARAVAAREFARTARPAGMYKRLESPLRRRAIFGGGLFVERAGMRAECAECAALRDGVARGCGLSHEREEWKSREKRG